MTDTDGRSMPEGSPILAMHQRYEALGRAFNILDEETSGAGEGTTRDRRNGLAAKYEDAKKRISSEEDTLRVAILMVPPQDMTDAMVLTFHATSLYDMVRSDAGGSKRPEELAAVGVALDQLLNFFACTVPQDHERLGPLFQGVVGHVFDKGRLLDGDIEGQELDKPSDAWPEALATYRAARAAVEAADSEADQDGFDGLVDVQTAAFKALLAVPAPDNAALATKLEIIDAEGFHEAPNVWPSVLADARRLGPA